MEDLKAEEFAVTVEDCDECKGTGEVECDRCQGFGAWTECHHGANCPCDGYKVTCSECDERGVKYCTVCDGQGHYEVEVES